MVVADHLDGDDIDEGMHEAVAVDPGSGRLALDARATTFQTRERGDEIACLLVVVA